MQLTDESGVTSIDEKLQLHRFRIGVGEVVSIRDAKMCTPSAISRSSQEAGKRELCVCAVPYLILTR